MPYRKTELITGETYHVINKSIAKFIIFKNSIDYSRMLEMLRYYQLDNPPFKFSHLKTVGKKTYQDAFSQRKKMVKISAYCIMPTHIHLLLTQFRDNSISTFMNILLNSYSKYFNTKYSRKGPLWESRFKVVHVKTDEQLLHLTRYIHLNPTSASLVKKPQEWEFSSYKEYLDKYNGTKKICDFKELVKFKQKDYQKFVEEQIKQQRELSIIKAITLE